ncbi:hypothetical protein D9613_009223 [Agrocybe pediades]|uniref:Uncharacterized protein n=1 Tax=Agrocybe pediades TaxID=84607 RepID=A0A8H4VWA0_9AGAR|nr:hypothetical protein D9613_009223 [Agrocybe pediades]
MGSIVSAIGRGINAIISAIANVIMTIIGAITTSPCLRHFCIFARASPDSKPTGVVFVVIVTTFAFFSGNSDSDGRHHKSDELKRTENEGDRMEEVTDWVSGGSGD